MPAKKQAVQPDIVNDDIFTLMGIPNATDDQKQSMVGSMMQTVQNRVLARLVDTFDTKEDRKKFDIAIGKKDYDTVNKMLTAQGMPEFLSLVAQEVLLYKQEVAHLARTNAS